MKYPFKLLIITCILISSSAFGNNTYAISYSDHILGNCVSNPAAEKLAESQGRTLLNEALWTAEISYFVENNFFTTDLYAIGLIPYGVQHHIVGFFAPSDPPYAFSEVNPNLMNTKEIHRFLRSEGLETPFWFSPKMSYLLNEENQAACPESNDCTVYGEGATEYEAFAYGNIDCDDTLDVAWAHASVGDGPQYYLNSTDLNTRTRQEWRSQVEIAFHSMRTLQTSHYVETLSFSNDLQTLGWYPPRGELAYKFGFLPSPDGAITETDQYLEILMEDRTYPPYSYNGNNNAGVINFNRLVKKYCSDCGAREDGFKFLAIGNLDQDNDLDIWTATYELGKDLIVEQLENDM